MSSNSDPSLTTKRAAPTFQNTKPLCWDMNMDRIARGVSFLISRSWFQKASSSLTEGFRGVPKAYHGGPPVQRLGHCSGPEAAVLLPLLLLLLPALGKLGAALSAPRLKRAETFQQFSILLIHLSQLMGFLPRTAERTESCGTSPPC